MASITIKDVAKRAGVSIATVSYVVNQSRGVSPEIRERVIKAIEEVGYRPDETARSLRNKKTSMIGLIVPDNANPFFAEIAKGVEDAGFEAGYGVILCNSNSMIERELEYIDLLLSKRVDGILLASTSPTIAHAGEIIKAGVPLTIFYRQAAGIDVDCFYIDNLKAGAVATRHLLELGHRRIACIQARSIETSSGKRAEGYIQALAEYGIDPDFSLMPQGNNLINGGEECARQLLQSKKEFSAIFSANDAMAIGAMKALRDSGVRVPEDISIVGMDDIDLALYSVPPLTTVSQPKYEAGKMAIEHIVERIEGRYEGGLRDYLMDVHLIARESTQPIQPERES